MKFRRSGFKGVSEMEGSKGVSETGAPVSPQQKDPLKKGAPLHPWW